MKSYFPKSLYLFLPLLFSLKAVASNLPDELLNMPINLLSGKQVTLEDYQGKQPVYLKFWATWCQPCMKEMPHFQHVEQQYGDSIKTIGINLGLNDSEQSVQAIIKQFSLTMPMTIDNSGDLAKAFHFIGTPYHLLFDKQMNLVHLGHKADETLDNKIALVSQQETVDLLAAHELAENEANLALNLDDGKTHALLFTATWCDWYLKDSRPQMSKNCIAAQHNINALAKEYPQLSWQTLVSRLWTGDKDLASYQKKYKISHHANVDKSNYWFHRYQVNSLPELILVQNDQVIQRISELTDKKQLSRIIAELSY